MKHLAVAAVLVGCGGGDVVIEPVFESPVDDPDATATGLDSLELSVAHAGKLEDILSQSFAPGAGVNLDGVPFADDLVIHLTGRIGGSDVAYGRTCKFAVSTDSPRAEPHLFFSRSVKFATIGIASVARVGGMALSDREGTAIVIGGAGPDGAVRTAERFDPRTGELSEIAQLAARTGAMLVSLGAGTASRVAIVGGSGPGIVEVLELDDPGGVRVERVDDDRLARAELTATTLIDGRVIVIGGRRGDGLPTTDIVGITASSGAIELATARSKLALARAGHTATRLGDDVGAPLLVAGGRDATNATVDVAELFKPLSGELANPATFAPRMVVPRFGHQARLMPDGSVLFIGGLDSAGMPVRTLERFTVDGGFVAVGELPVAAGVVELTTTALPDGRILLAGGRATATGPEVDAAFIARLDVVDGGVDVVRTDPLSIARAGHQAALLCDGTVFVTGGTTTPSITERYNPPPFGRR